MTAQKDNTLYLFELAKMAAAQFNEHAAGKKIAYAVSAKDRATGIAVHGHPEEENLIPTEVSVKDQDETLTLPVYFMPTSLERSFEDPGKLPRNLQVFYHYGFCTN